MKIRLVVLLVLAFCVKMHAQNFMKQLQTKAPNGATVVVREDAKIDELVNNEQTERRSETSKKTVSDYPAKSKTVAAREQKTTVEHKRNASTAATSVEKTHKTTSERQHTPDSSMNNKAENEREEKKNAEESGEDEDIEIATVDLRKKVMRNSYKVTGFRVQVFAGGNSRADRQKAERIGNDVKMNFPDQPVYTHFYPPRWICRVGNYRSYAEASRMLKSVKHLGYRQACIVKGKISVQY